MNSQYIYLTSPCPENCKCGNTQPKQWLHKKCNTRAKINNQGDISCEGGCEPYFIQDTKFECSHTEKSGRVQASYRSLAEFFRALSVVTESAGFDIQFSHDQNEFIRILTSEIGKRWIY